MPFRVTAKLLAVVAGVVLAASPALAVEKQDRLDAFCGPLIAAARSFYQQNGLQETLKWNETKEFSSLLQGKVTAFSLLSTKDNGTVVYNTLFKELAGLTDVHNQTDASGTVFMKNFLDSWAAGKDVAYTQTVWPDAKTNTLLPWVGRGEWADSQKKEYFLCWVPAGEL